MKLNSFFQGSTLRDFLKSVITAGGILAILVLVYFYLYLPVSTNFNEELMVPDLLGFPSGKIDSAISATGLRYEISDSSYSEKYGPLEIIGQFPKPGSLVKPGRKLFFSINRSSPPTVAIPEIIDLSLINAEANLNSIGLKRGLIIYQPGPFADLVMGLSIGSKAILPGYRVPKGTIINLIVGDGAGSTDFTISDLVGMSLDNAMLLIFNSNLQLGEIRLGPGADTTGVEAYVYKQEPIAGHPVQPGELVNLWIGPMDYMPQPEEPEN
jgi:beta-lactam-binding protein with PASTA domain